jgi:hypothetical protein
LNEKLSKRFFKEQNLGNHFPVRRCVQEGLQRWCTTPTVRAERTRLQSVVGARGASHRADGKRVAAAVINRSTEEGQ